MYQLVIDPLFLDFATNINLKVLNNWSTKKLIICHDELLSEVDNLYIGILLVA